MNEELKNKIKNEIFKSGFPLELEMTEKLRFQENALVFSNIAFQGDDKTLKELDIVAILQDEENEWTIGPVGTQVLIECKKSEKYPWVFFEDVYDPLSVMGLVYRADYCTDLKLTFKNVVLMSCQHTDLRQHYYNDPNIPTAKTYFEALKTSNDSTIYKAVMNIFHGRKYLKGLFEKQFSEKENPKKFRTFLKQYVIVLDGQLILASKANTDFTLEEANHILLRVQDTITNVSHRDYLGDEIFIDVISGQYFDTYIDLSRKGVGYFNKHLKLIQQMDMFEKFISTEL